jgi:hypothetical protein
MRSIQEFCKLARILGFFKAWQIVRDLRYLRKLGIKIYLADVRRVMSEETLPPGKSMTNTYISSKSE